MKRKLINYLAQNIKTLNITYKIKTMAFQMRGLPQYGDEGPKQLGHRLKSIFGPKEQREQYKQYFEDKKAAKKSLKESGLHGEVSDMSVLEGKNLGKSTGRTRRRAAKAYAQDNLDGANEIDAVYTTKKVKKKNVQGGANAAAYANVNRGTGVVLDVDFDVDVKKYNKDTSGAVKNKVTKTIIPGEKKSETFTGPDALKQAQNREDELFSQGMLKAKDGANMKSEMGYKMKSHIMAVAASKGTGAEKIMQQSNPNPVNTTTTNISTSRGYGSGTQTDTDQDDYNKPGKVKPGNENLMSDEDWKKFTASESAKDKEIRYKREVEEGRREAPKNIPGSSSTDQNVTVNYQTPSTTKTSTSSEVTNLGGKKGRKVSIDADVDADAKIKLPKIGKFVTGLVDKVGDSIEKGKQKRKKKKQQRNQSRGNCPPCPPCN